MTLSKLSKFEENISTVIASIDRILKGFCSYNGLNLSAMLENL